MNGKQAKMLQRTEATKRDVAFWKTLPPVIKGRMRSYCKEEWRKGKRPSFINVCVKVMESFGFKAPEQTGG